MVAQSLRSPSMDIVCLMAAYVPPPWASASLASLAKRNRARKLTGRVLIFGTSNERRVAIGIQMAVRPGRAMGTPIGVRPPSALAELRGSTLPPLSAGIRCQADFPSIIAHGDGSRQ